jgi:predicted Zn-dependent protease
LGAREHQREPVPPPSNLLMRGGDGSLADSIASTKRGVLITSLWYIRCVDPRRLSCTGLTRDGVFRIEDGKISHPLPNLRWNDSPISVPALRVKEFELSSVSDAV